MDFEGFYKHNSGLLYRWAYSYTRDRETARDVVQEACMIVYQRWNRIGVMSSPLGYVLRVIGNLAKKHSRKPRVVLLEDEEWDRFSCEHDVEKKIEAQITEAWIYEALETLKEIERQVVLLRDVEEMDFATLAGQLHINLSTAKSHYRRAKLKLLQKWEESYGKHDV